MLDKSIDLFKLAVALGFVILLLISSNASAESSCICYYAGDCIYDPQGGMYRYSQCSGSCYHYSGYRYEPKCAALRTSESKVYDKIELV